MENDSPRMEDDSPHWSQKSTTSASSYTSTPQGGDQFSVSPGSGSVASAALDPALWKLVERGDICPFEDCAFTVDALAFGVNGDAGGEDGGSAVEDGSEGGAGDGDGRREKKRANRSRCRHFHTLCGCRHTRGALKGLLFQVRFYHYYRY